MNESNDNKRATKIPFGEIELCLGPRLKEPRIGNDRIVYFLKDRLFLNRLNAVMRGFSQSGRGRHRFAITL
jgi:hypothetical protein